mgnify:CR=1 FL=1
MARRRIAALVTVALVVSAVMSTQLVLPGRCVGDVNGDSQANVLDVQLVAAALLGSTDGPAPTVDVNEDGRVDVLDFQALVAQTSESTEPPEPTQRQLPPAAPVCSTAAPVPHALTIRVAHADPAGALPQAPACAMARAGVPCSSRLPHLPRIERYLCGVSPHSPPLPRSA